MGNEHKSTQAERRTDTRAGTRADTGADTWADTETASRWNVVASPAPSRRHRRLLVLTAVLSVLAGALTALLVAVAPPRTAGSAPAGAVDLPPPGVDAHPQRLRPAVTGPSGSGGYAFTLTQADTGAPVGYDPCRPLRYVINPKGAPTGGTALVREAATHVGDASGLALTPGAATTEPPRKDRPVYQPARYGQRWAPVLIAWTTPTQVPELAGDAVGIGGSTPVTGPDGHLTYVTGTVYLDAPQVATMLRRADGRRSVRAVIEHELGHVLGLAHVDDPTQLMFPQERDEGTELAEGDRRGLAHLGAGTCAPDL